MSYISFQNVSKIYQMGEVEIKALDDMSFDIEKGEFVTILGASGAGKRIGAARTPPRTPQTNNLIWDGDSFDFLGEQGPTQP